METDIDALRARAAQLRAQADALQARAVQQERARETRKKVLLGALVLHDLQSVSSDEVWLRDYLERRAWYFKESDRELVAQLPPPADTEIKRGRGRPRKAANIPGDPEAADVPSTPDVRDVGGDEA